ncbi:MAG TPA: NADH-quinone oxidoreductase subunit L, partial [Caldimonas sp.]
MPGVLTAIVLLPLLGFLLNGVLATQLGGNLVGKRFVTVVGCGLPLLAFALAIKSVLDLQAGGYAPLVETAYRWALIGSSSFDVAFYFDRLTAIMVLVVTGVGSVIHVYSVGYMAHDKSFGRFFAYLNLFLFFMLLLVLGRSLLVLFVGWEGVGLASYLLIGFWFDDLANAVAGKKAFITNRVGDAGFLLGMFVLYQAFGTLDMDRINAAFGVGAAAVVPAGLVGILLFIGATGKSAQIPLHVWLPDAMAGPTPVSALIHAATMVTAGVYLVARMSGIYLQAPEASMVIAVIGVATAFFAATIAIAQSDIKKVLAYSTISQLGFMFLALGVGAYGVAIFHLVTHAFFKACLFLGAGSVIHALSGEQDMRKMGGLARKIPVTFVTFAVATAAIAGIPPLAGFFSKDEILWYAFASTRGGSPLLWLVAAATALMTAFYMFRLLWLTFLGSSRV